MTGHPPAIEVHRIRPGEHAVCARIHTDAWNASLPGFPRTADVVEFDAGIEGELTFVARVRERVAGYISAQEDEWFVHHLYVDPEFQGTGVGTALISHVEALAGSHPVSLKCVSENRSAMGFYLASGFTRASETGTGEYGVWHRLVKTRASRRP